MLQGTYLVFAAVAYSVGVFVLGGLVFRNNASKVNEVIGSSSGLEVRVQALEAKALADLKNQLAQAKAETTKATNLVTQVAQDIKQDITKPGA